MIHLLLDLLSFLMYLNCILTVLPSLKIVLYRLTDTEKITS